MEGCGGGISQIIGRRVDGHTGKLLLDGTPSTRIPEPEPDHRGETENDHEELKHLRVDRGSKPALEHIKQHDEGANPERDVVFPTEKIMQELRQCVQGDTRGKDRHHCKGDRIEGTGSFVEAKLQVLGDGTGLRAVVKGHHEDGQEDHRRNRPDPVEVAGCNAVLGTTGRHPDQFKRTEIGRKKGKSRHPGRYIAAGEKEVGRGLHLPLQGEADTDNKDDVEGEDRIIYRSEMY